MKLSKKDVYWYIIENLEIKLDHKYFCTKFNPYDIQRWNQMAGYTFFKAVFEH